MIVLWEADSRFAETRSIKGVREYKPRGGGKRETERKKGKRTGKVIEYEQGWRKTGAGCREEKKII